MNFMMGCQLQRHRQVRLGCERDPEPSCFLKAPSIGRGSAGQQRCPKSPHPPYPSGTTQGLRHSACTQHCPASTTSHTDPSCPKDMWQGSGPHEQGLGTGCAGIQLLLAPNKACFMPQSAGCLRVHFGAREHPLCSALHRARGAQDHSPAPSTKAGCPSIRCHLPAAASCPGSSPVLVVDVVSKARGVNDRQLHANPFLFNL